MGGGSNPTAPRAAVEYIHVPCDMCAGAGQIEGLGTCPMCNGAKTKKGEKPSAAVTQAAGKELVVDAAKPKTKIQLQLPDGTKKAEEFNCDHTIGDLRSHCVKLA